jgi:hypothetical protein
MLLLRPCDAFRLLLLTISEADAGRSEERCAGIFARLAVTAWLSGFFLVGTLEEQGGD